MFFAFISTGLNGNGIIDEGSELFGEGTFIIGESRKADNGYEAIAQYDLPENGGNGDGVLSSYDSI